MFHTVSKKYTGYLIIAAAASSIFSPSVSQAFTVADVLGHVLPTNPEIKVEKSEEAASAHQIDQEKAGFYPTVEISTRSGYEYTKDKFSRNELSTTESNGTVDNNRHDPTVTITQPIYSGGGTISRVEKAEGEHLQASRRLSEKVELVGFKAVESYISIRRFQRLWRLAQKNVKAHESILRKIRALIAGGRATKADLYTVESRLHDARTAVVDIEGDLSTSIANFIEAVGFVPDRLQNAQMPETAIPGSLDDAMAKAASDNRSVRLAATDIRIAQADIKVSKAPFHPTVDFEVEGKRNFNVGAKTGTENKFTALVVARWNLFNGGADLARKKELIERLASARHDLERVKRVAEKEIRVSWGEMKSSGQQAVNLRLAVKAKEKVVDVYLAQFDLGTRSLLDVLDAQNEFFLAKGALITADATQDLTEARLLAAMGYLYTALDVPAGGREINDSELKEVSSDDPTVQVVQRLARGA
ncbi:MAG: TolC family outer membrane protein [bacterium]|nr:TolC family outer membrane protein [bacterium]